ncbi:P-loop containing nucleoside triphosphate hydrolase protein, partial [Peziza echinospora]
FIKNLKAIAINEAHCIWKWGESGFRPEYKNLGTLRALFPKVPIGVFSATMVRSVLSYVHTSLGMNNPSYIYQQTTSRDNISLVVARIKHPKSYKDLDFLFGKGTTARWQIPKTMIFIDNCSETVAMAQYLRALLPAALSPDSVSIVRSYHGHLEGLTREDIIESMQEGNCLIIVCTEACGMGLDLADIRRTLIWKVEKHLTLAELWQRSGRCVCDRLLMGVAILFV